MCDKAALRRAFLQGAKFWEFYKTGGTMWQSDQRICVIAAEEIDALGELGVDSPIATKTDCKGEG